ncbi:MAG: hypothetical protein LBD25_04140 [Coriobacteriales bacterium]|jgi:hypothetical protein|nr:hypothetical protein [Coriobacteriales bacterium]
MTSVSGSINSYDLDGVITLGITPGPDDIIITGRSFEEARETYRYLHSRGILNAVFFQPRPFASKTRESSGAHKGMLLQQLLHNGVRVEKHFEDDEVQKQEIEKLVDIPVVHLVHDLTEKENVRHPYEG